jgi:hypothetical protein
MLSSDAAPQPAPYTRLLRLGAAHTVKRGLKLLPGVQAVSRAVNPPRPDPNNGRCAIRDFFILKDMAARHGVTITGKSVLEIGSGWFPIFSVLFALYGARKVFFTDITSAMDSKTFAEALRFLPEGAATLVEEGTITAEDARFIAAKVRDVRWNDGRFEYLAPFNPTTSRVAADLIVSRTVIEHISEGELRPTLTAFRRMLSPDGHMLHAIDNSDHLSHGDRSISPVNFLTIPRAVWRVINSLTYPQNRMRHDSYSRLFADCGCDVIAARGHPHPRALNDLRRFEARNAIDPDYKRAPGIENLAILDSYFLLRNAPRGDTRKS